MGHYVVQTHGEQACSCPVSLLTYWRRWSELHSWAHSQVVDTKPRLSGKTRCNFTGTVASYMVSGSGKSRPLLKDLRWIEPIPLSPFLLQWIHDITCRILKLCMFWEWKETGSRETQEEIIGKSFACDALFWLQMAPAVRKINLHSFTSCFPISWCSC